MNKRTNRRARSTAATFDCRGGGGAGGLTLLEVVIALTLLAALAAIVAPSVLDRLDERAFEAAADGTSEQLMMARAHAQATGEAVEVTYRPQTGEVQARLYAPWNAGSHPLTIEPGTSPLASSSGESKSAGSFNASRQGAQESRSAPSWTPPFAPGSGSDLDATDRPIAEGWASRVLGSGISIGTHRPSGESAAAVPTDLEWCLPDSSNLLPENDEDVETLEDLESGQSVRLAVFMPDGSAMVGEDLWLNDERGRVGRITINPWSGLPIFQRLADLTDAALSDDASTDDVDGSPREIDGDDAPAARSGGAAFPAQPRVGGH